MSLLFRVKSARASAIKLQIGHVSHEYRVTRSSSSTRSNLALAQQAQKALWYNGSGQVEPGKFPLRKTRTSSYFKRQITELNEFYASQIEPHRAKVKFAGSEEKPFVMEHKRQIKKLLQTHAPHLNWRHYVAAAEVFPMRANNYFLENHINWANIPNDPMFKLVFPQPEMLTPSQLQEVLNLDGKSEEERQKVVEEIRNSLNAHPAGQKTLNVPLLDGKQVKGMQHKYRETLLFFPKEGQFCHCYCTYCFRWPQFVNVGSPEQQFHSGNANELLEYVKRHKNITDLLITGGDAMVASAQALSKYIEPLLNNPDTDHLQTIRFGTKALAHWPATFTTDDDAAAKLALFKRIQDAEKLVSIQAHFTHPVELKTKAVKQAIRNIQAAGAIIRTQAPIIRGINDSADCWAEMWNLQTRLGLVPYYAFVERDTGAKEYFRVPLYRTVEIVHDALIKAPGTASTARGPSMSAGPGKISIVGISEGMGEKVFVLKFLQARNPEWCRGNKLFYAKYDEEAYWLDDLKPAFGKKEWFWEAEYKEMEKDTEGASSGQRVFEKN